MESCNTYYINLLISCENGDQDALDEMDMDYMRDRQKKIIFNEELIEKITELSDNGNSHAISALGTFYCHGCSVPMNKQKGKELYKKAIMKGNVYATVNLGIWYRDNGYIEKAKKLFETAIEMGNIDALILLEAMCHSHIGHHNIAPMHVKAAKLFKAKKCWCKFSNAISNIFEYYSETDIECLKELICDTDDEIYSDVIMEAAILIFKKSIQHERLITRKEISKTILRTKNIPIEIIDNEINSKI